MGARVRVQGAFGEIVKDDVKGRDALHIGGPDAVLEVEEYERNDVIGGAQHPRPAPARNVVGGVCESRSSAQR
jgi:hypothetical protein